ncbi:MAG: hypothetical protein AMK71_09885 [Nitrospira bacterium SG8_35_4]|nr:MAG: hypothetical protein AMK71_09885 [Nitrospira bacterium SG8_35_4]
MIYKTGFRYFLFPEDLDFETGSLKQLCNIRSDRILLQKSSHTNMFNSTMFPYAGVAPLLLHPCL